MMTKKDFWQWYDGGQLWLMIGPYRVCRLTMTYLDLLKFLAERRTT